MSMQVVRIAEPNPPLEMDIRSLLKAEGLSAPPCEDADFFAIFDEEGRVEAAAFACLLEDAGFIHAVVVRADSRKKGLGYALVGHIVNQCFTRGLKLCLVALKAKGFFERFGFEEVPREGLPASIVQEAWFRDYDGMEAPFMILAPPKGERMFGD